MNNKLYAVRDTETGELVKYLTTPQHKYWEKRGFAERAIKDYEARRVRRKHGQLELVCFELVEVEDEP